MISKTGDRFFNNFIVCLKRVADNQACILIINLQSKLAVIHSMPTVAS